MPTRSEKKVMMCIRFNSLLLGLLLSLAFMGDCTAEAQHGIGALAKNVQGIRGDSKGLHGETRTAPVTRSKWLRGRKMGVGDVTKEVMEAKHTVNEGENPSIGKSDHGMKGELNLELKLRGKAKKSSEKSFGSSNLDEQGTRSTTLKSRKLATFNNNSPVNPSNTPQLNTPSSDASAAHDRFPSQAVSKPPLPQESDDLFQTLETKNLVDATTEVFNMLSKDYQTKASRRPPINNDLPLEQIEVEP